MINGVDATKMKVGSVVFFRHLYRDKPEFLEITEIIPAQPENLYKLSDGTFLDTDHPFSLLLTDD